MDFDSASLIRRLTDWFGKDTVDNILSGLPNRSRVDILYYPEINEFKGVKKVQIKTVNMRRSA